MSNKWELCESKNWHYAASVFPLLEREELEALATDIQEHGLLNPIIRCGGKILDGRNRVLACRLVQTEPRYRDISPEDANAWAISQNCYRRHLTPNQDAFALHSLSIISGEKIANIKGKTRERAYKKLAKLKETLIVLAETLPPNIAECINQLVKTKEEKKEVSDFESLFYKLNPLLPSCSDGVENVTVRLLESVCNLPKEKRSPLDEEFLQLIVPMLKRISINFSTYADKLCG